jgi:hypothetical protein
MRDKLDRFLNTLATGWSHAAFVLGTVLSGQRARLVLFGLLVSTHGAIVLGHIVATLVMVVLAPWYIAFPLAVLVTWHASSRVVDCPLTRFENSLRKSLGMKPIGGFIGHYFVRPVKRLLGLSRRPVHQLKLVTAPGGQDDEVSGSAIDGDGTHPIYLTWLRLSKLIADMPVTRLNDPVQIMAYQLDRDKPIELWCAYGVNTTGYYCSTVEGVECDTTRGVLDNRHHPEHYVIHADRNPYDEEDNMFYTLQPDGGLVGNATGRPPREEK